MTQKYTKKIPILILSLIIINFLYYFNVFAQLEEPDLPEPIINIDASSREFKTDTFAAWAGLKNAPPSNLISDIIKIILGLIGVIFLILIIISGFEWMMSGGDSEKIKKARSRIKNAVIGIIIIVFSYILVSLVFSLIGGVGGYGSAASST